jgi:hypothetical protein
MPGLLHPRGVFHDGRKSLFAFYGPHRSLPRSPRPCSAEKEFLPLQRSGHCTAPAPRCRAPPAALTANLQAARERLTPLEDRLARLLATIPIEIQREGLSLSSLQTSLRGRWRGNCHPGELGSALRRLGFKRERRWYDEGGFRALWYPAQ